MRAIKHLISALGHFHEPNRLSQDEIDLLSAAISTHGEIVKREGERILHKLERLNLSYTSAIAEAKAEIEAMGANDGQ